MCTSDGWFDLPMGWGKNDLDSFTYDPHGLRKETKEAFQPIPVRYGKREWLLAKQGTGTDVLLQAHEQGFTAHKIMLVARSSFFRAMFGSSFKEGKDTGAVVQLKDMDPAVFKCLLRFMYTGTLSRKTQTAYAADPSKLSDLLVQGDFLGLDGIGIWAAEFIQRALKGRIPDHVYTTLFEVALKTQCDELLDALIGHTKTNLDSDTFVHAVGEASLNELISKETWEKIREKAGIVLLTTIQGIENFNPYIRKLLQS
jgi:hypothetical protein